MEERYVAGSRIKFPCLQNLTWNEKLFKEGLDFVCSLFRVPRIFPDQETVLKKFFQGKHVYFSAPTGYGKSLIYQSMPMIADYLLGRPVFTSIVLVISPLKALMYDQVKYLRSLGLNAVAITGEEDESTLKELHENGGYNLVFASPECMLGVKRWRDYLNCEHIKENLIAVVFDEAHCISQWGYGTAKSSPFRKWYHNLFELRSLLDSSVRLATFTATATTVTKTRIFETLGLYSLDTFCLEKSPLKNNIKFSVTFIGNDIALENILMDSINKLLLKKESAERLLIYCHSRTQCGLIWQLFASKLGKKFYLHERKDAKYRLVEMFHAGTPPQIKNHIVDLAAQENSHLRVIICTVAFGMGVNCAGFNQVIHFGPSRNMEAYLQECGRSGRNGELSVCHLLYNSLLTSRCEDDIKEYVYQTGCRRAAIGKWFGNTAHERVDCPCCDVCAAKCECDINKSCQELLQFQIADNDKAISDLRTRKVTKVQLETLQESLNSYLLKRRTYTENDKVLSCYGSDFEFNELQVNQILKSCQYFFSIEDVMSKVEIWRNIDAENILCMVAAIFQDIQIGNMEIDFNFGSDDDINQEIPAEWRDIRMDNADSYMGLPADSSFLAEIDSLLDSVNASHDNLGNSGILDSSSSILVSEMCANQGFDA